MEGRSAPSEFVVPSAPRIAARSIALVGVCGRAMLELEDSRKMAEFKRLHLCEWIDRLGVMEELEDSETTLLDTPCGLLDEQTMINAFWRAEGMLVLAWALGRCELGRYDENCNGGEIAGRLGFLSERSQTVLENPTLRDVGEIQRWRNTYLTIHWRLRQYGIDHASLDLADVVSCFNWGPLKIEDLDLIDGDLAIRGRRIDRASGDDREHTRSIAMERHKAFNWLLGSNPIYSAVSTDT
jgi:hypothetical protein